MTVNMRYAIFRRLIRGFEAERNPDEFDACAIGDLFDFAMFAIDHAEELTGEEESAATPATKLVPSCYQ